LYLFDGVIQKTTLKTKFFKGGTAVGRVIIEEESTNHHDQDPSLLS